MFCEYCGKPIDDNSRFCCHCGAKVVPTFETINTEKPSVRNKVFAFVGFGLGIASFVFSLIPVCCFYSLLFAIPGMIFSKYGLSSEKESFARKGKVFSISGLIIGIVMSILTIVLMVFLIEEYGYDVVYY